MCFSQDPFLYISGFILFWIGATALASVTNGWYQLSKRFPATDDFTEIESFRFATLALGGRRFPGHYNNCVFIKIGRKGIRLSVLFLFRVLSPPMLIPWEEIESAEREKYRFCEVTTLSLKNEKRKLRFFGEPGKAIFEMRKRQNIAVFEKK